MTKPSLVAARPWDHEDARAGLLERAAAARGHIGDTAVSVLLEPMLTHVEGRAVQSLRVILPSAVQAQAAQHGLSVHVGGDRVDRTTSLLGPDALRVLVDRVDSSVAAVLRLPGLGEGEVALELTPQRRWTVHLVHHSHFDFGYTDPQDAVFASQRSYLDSALDLVDRTAGWPEAARFRWNAEALWAVTDWIAHRPPAQVQRLLCAVRDGSIGLSALPYNLHTDVCSTDELHELLRHARRLRDQHGLELVSAMQTDVPGQVAGLPDALAAQGVRYLSVAHNWAGRSEPLRHGGLELPRLFRWRSPAGREVLVWMTDSPHGLAYLEGSMLGFGDAYPTVDRYLPAYLTALATRGFPYPVGVFGAHGESFERAEPYPWDVLHVRALGFMGDNGPARLLLSEIVRDWNETWEWPQLRVSRNEDFFADAEARVGDELQTFEGDWGDWWVEGVGSAAVPMAQTRAAQARVTDARTLSRMSAWRGGSPVDTEAAEAEATYDAISMFNEHTWGAGNSWTHGDAGFDSGEQQWRWKVAQSLAAHQTASESVEKALSYLGQTAGTSDGAAATYLVANTSGRPRSGVVRFLLPESVVALTHEITLRDGRGHGVGRAGGEVPFTLSAQTSENHRESGRWVCAHVVDVPATGTIRLDVVARGVAATSAPAAEAATSTAAEGLRSRLPDLPPDQVLSIENEYLRLVLDPERSVIASLVERSTGRQLLRDDGVVGFNGYVYDEYASSGAGVNHLANKLSSSDRLELLADRTVAGPARVVERTEDAVESRLVYEFTGRGVERVQVTLRLRRGDPWLLIENRLTKPRTRTKESAFFAFPFAGVDPRLRYEVSGGVTGAGRPHIPGAPRHMRAVRDWVTVGDGAEAVAWVTRDIPLVQPHALALPYSPFPDSTSPREPGTIFSWVHNNLWDTNFPIEQAFEAEFHYAVGVARTPGLSPESIALETADELVHPLRAVLARGVRAAPGPDASAPGASMVELSDPRVRLVCVAGAPDGTLVRLQSMTAQPVALRLTSGATVSSAARASYLGDPGDPLPVGASVEVALAPYESTAVLLRP